MLYLEAQCKKYYVQYHNFSSRKFSSVVDDSIGEMPTSIAADDYKLDFPNVPASHIELVAKLGWCRLMSTSNKLRGCSAGWKECMISPLQPMFAR